ncbi:MAG TPA: cytochrome c-type biogenesis protein CcmH [Thermoanaerobaculia bacterium]|nr:cytochrome c-type biogenesis protein CcmH [Thermoanaerobaculia bacterium]
MIVTLLLAVAISTPPQGQPLSGPALDQRTQEVASLLRCPVCQGMSVADSPSTVAQDMKHQVRDMLSKGYTQEQILSYFEKSYGQFVLEKPKNPLVWILPILILIIGAVVVATTAKKLSAEPTAATADPEPATDPYVEQVRKLVNHD